MGFNYFLRNIRKWDIKTLLQLGKAAKAYVKTYLLSVVKKHSGKGNLYN